MSPSTPSRTSSSRTIGSARTIEITAQLSRIDSIVGNTTGQPIVARFAVKPTSSILTPRHTVDTHGNDTEISTKGRHDPCVGIRGAPVVEAMMALVLADQKLLHRAQCG